MCVPTGVYICTDNMHTHRNDRILIKIASHCKNHKIKSEEEMEETRVQEEKKYKFSDSERRAQSCNV